ncbi:hypothetical protein ACNSOL_12405 (plasmid) [Aliarcobacter lanthieri]|uniref:hypothetical protein n=1 Tax=Aliarcobacter lanthieri TaxID=1355374 RepID=UPI003AAE4B1F
MSINQQSTLLTQAMEVFEKRASVKKAELEIKQEIKNSCERMIEQIQHSNVIPEQLRGQTSSLVEIAKMAEHRNVPFLNLVNNLLFIEGKMGWKSTYIISCINKAKDRFSTPLNYKTVGKEGDDSYGKKAYCYDIKGNLVEGPTVTLKIAKEAGWTDKVNSSWNTLPELMLSYRAATFFGRLYCPDILDGIHTVEELVDIYSSSGSLPDEAIDKKIMEFIKNSEVEKQHHSQENFLTPFDEFKEVKPNSSESIEELIEEFENNGFCVTNPTFHKDRFYIKVEPLNSVLLDQNLLVKWGFGRTKNNQFVKEVTNIMTEEEKNEYK